MGKEKIKIGKAYKADNKEKGPKNPEPELDVLERYATGRKREEGGDLVHNGRLPRVMYV